MGEGLYFDPDGVTVYAEPLEDLDDSVDDADRLAAWAAFEAHLRGCLTETWTPTARRTCRGAAVIAANAFYEMTVYEDSYGRAHVTVRTRGDLNPARAALARATLDAAARVVFRRLARLHPLHMRATAWTSAPYRPDPDRSVA